MLTNTNMLEWPPSTRTQDHLIVSVTATTEPLVHLKAFFDIRRFKTVLKRHLVKRRLDDISDGDNSLFENVLICRDVANNSPVKIQ